MSEKLIELEIKIMHLEQANQELSDEHYKQQQQIERLEKQVKILNDQFKQLPEYKLLTDTLDEKLNGLPGFIITIDGFYGCGKTSLGRYLAYKYNVTLLETDLFIEKPGLPVAYNYECIKQIIQHRLGSRSPIIVEGIFCQKILKKLGYTKDYSIFVKKTEYEGDDPLHEEISKYHQAYNIPSICDKTISISLNRQ